MRISYDKLSLIKNVTGFSVFGCRGGGVKCLLRMGKTANLVSVSYVSEKKGMFVLKNPSEWHLGGVLTCASLFSSLQQKKSQIQIHL